MNTLRNIARIIVTTAVAAATSIPTSAYAAFAPPSLSVPSATLGTMDGTHLWSSNQDSQRRVASTIKMLNALVVREHAGLSEVVTIPKQASAIWDGDVGLRAGQRVKVSQLLDMMLVVSANDAAEALAIHVSGSERRHVARMNAKARQLGMTRTIAADPHGLGKREQSTARDLAVLGRAFMADPVLRKIVLKRSVSVPRPGRAPVVYRATNQLLGSYAGIEGVKTGFTRPAGYCLVAAAKRGDVEIIGVVLGASSLSGRFSQMRKLLDWGFKHTHVRTLVSTTETFTVTPSPETTAPPLVARPSSTVRKALLDGTSVTRRVVPIAPPGTQAAGQLGVLRLSVKSSLLATVALMATEPTAAVSVP